jgi:hypothetical protein
MPLDISSRAIRCDAVLMVIFGAGASYDSVPSLRASDHGGSVNRPPLARELFSDRPEFREALLEFDEFHALVDRLRTLPDGLPLEKFLGELQAESTRLKHLPRQLLAIKFYLARISHGSSGGRGTRRRPALRITPH